MGMYTNKEEQEEEEKEEEGGGKGPYESIGFTLGPIGHTFFLEPKEKSFFRIYLYHHDVPLFIRVVRSKFPLNLCI